VESTWTITELAERAGAALADEPVRVNGRVRETPNERLIRWYTTIGLVDPPSGRRGRTALYGPRHLLQLVAVKRRQAAGRAIAEIQAELTGATDATLRDIARLPEEITAGTPPQRESRPRFWADPPSSETPQPTTPQPQRPQPRRPQPGTPRPRPLQPRKPKPELPQPGPPPGPPQPQKPEPGTPWVGTPAAETASAQPLSADQARSSAEIRPPSRQAEPTARPPQDEWLSGPSVVTGIRLGGGVTLLLGDGARPLTADDLAAIGDAAEPLLDVLRRRGLLDQDDRR
jgi:DNA-binding transcriptional MerR regulator